MPGAHRKALHSVAHALVEDAFRAAVSGCIAERRRRRVLLADVSC